MLNPGSFRELKDGSAFGGLLFTKKVNLKLPYSRHIVNNRVYSL